jgi:hypothetical protein
MCRGLHIKESNFIAVLLKNILKIQPFLKKNRFSLSIFQLSVISHIQHVFVLLKWKNICLWVSAVLALVLATLDIGYIGIGQISVKILGQRQTYQLSVKMKISVLVSVANYWCKYICIGIGIGKSVG